MEPAELVTALRPHLDGALVATDFDGTLAPLVADPQTSRPAGGAIEALRDLAARGARIAVITGRDAATVVRLGGLAEVPGIAVAGLYGLETWHDGTLSTPEPPPEIAVLRDRLPSAVEPGGPEVWIEDKRLSLVVHGRLADEPEAVLDPVRAPVADLAAELGFEVHAGRGVIELRLPGFDKAGALRRLIAQVSPGTVLFAGDDVGDLPAFGVVRELRAGGAAAFGVGVRSPEVPELADVVDVLVDGPAGVLELLERISGRS
jgi:trehalose 6-phosphate phosphatase